MYPRIVFMGTPKIAADVLQMLLDANANVVLAVSQPDKKTGRKQKVAESAVKQLALAHHIPVFQPVKIKEDYQAVLDAKPDLIVTCAYGQIVPDAVLQAPSIAPVNLHGSLLPEYRGAAPIQRAIMDGKTETGMALMKMESGMDTGGVLAVKKIAIDPQATSSDLFDKMGHLAGELLLESMPLLLHNPQFEPQDDSLATYASMISKDEEHLKFDLKDQEFYNTLRGLSAAPGGFVKVKGKKLKLLRARYEPAENTEPGLFEAVSKKDLALHLHQGKLHLLQVQMEGKPVMQIADFMNGQGRSLAGVNILEENR